MKIFGKTTISEFLGDLIVYRNLTPLDPRLPGLDALRDQVGLPAGRLPRKSETDYARVIVHLLQRARALDAPGTSIKRLIYVGDTRMNDGNAFANLCRAGGWPGLAFIGHETDEPAHTETMAAPTADEKANDQPTLYLSNRWSALSDFDRFCAAQHFPIDTTTAIVVDLDKTAMGARGRNAHVIDQVRVLAVRHTVADLLGDAFDESAFRTAYTQLNQPKFHPFTTDNQDYLAYICLILGSGLYDLQEIIDAVRAGRLTSFAQFIDQVQGQIDAMPPALSSVHREIYANVRAGDPTPFKAFRFNEYRATVSHMGQLGDDASVQKLLANEIVITQEVRAQALAWRDHGALLFGLSDKPDEASVPSDALAAQGYAAIHRTEMHAVGQV
jgi:hypothetical protein